MEEEWLISVLKGACVWVTHTSSTWVARGQDGVKVKSMIYLVLVKRDMLRYVQDVRAVRGK